MSRWTAAAVARIALPPLPRPAALLLPALLLAPGCAAPPADDGGDSAAPHAAVADAAAAGVPGAGSDFRFVDVAAAAGITVVTHAGRPGKVHLLDSAGTGAGWLDYDGDGRLDLYVVNAWRVEGSTIAERGRHALYRNRGDGTFEDVTAAAGVGGDGDWGSGVAVADVDDDGRPDLFVTHFGANILYRNRGDGTFDNVAPRVGLTAPGWNTGAAFFDADGDGRLDLYVAAYIDATVDDVLAARRELEWKGVEKVAVGPFGLVGARDHFFMQRPDGSFVDRTVEAGMQDRARGYGFGVRAADFDDDGDLDVYVANDSDANYLYRNEGGGRFKETGLWSGAAFDANGAAQAGMGVAVGDVNGDLLLDLFVTNFAEDFSTLYIGEGGGFFRDGTQDSGLGAATFLPLSWGTALADLDDDGDLDLVIANGHIYPQVDAHPDFGQHYRQRDQLFANRGDGVFDEVGEGAGPGFALERASRGVAVADYDDDGDLDLLITALDAPPALLRNDSTSGHWLTVDCRARPGSGGTIGTRVVVEAGGRRQIRDVASSGSFMSAHDPRCHFGLGRATVAERVEVRWPDGTTSLLTDVPADRAIVVDRP